MAVTASGPLSLPLENVRTLLKNVSAFQAWVGAADAAAAASSIHLVAAEPTIPRPFALVFFCAEDTWGRERIFEGSHGYYEPAGSVRLLFADDVAVANQDSFADSGLQFLNDVGGIISGMEDLAGSGGYINLTAIRKVDGPKRAGKEESEDYYFIEFALDWGV